MLADLAAVLSDALALHLATITAAAEAAESRTLTTILQQSEVDLERRVDERTSELQAALRENSRLAAAIDSAATGILICDARQPDTPIIFVNPAFTAITGYAREEVLGRNCRFLQGPGADPAVLAEMRAAQAERRAFRGMLLNYRKDGIPFWNGLTISPVFDDAGELVNFVGVQADLTARVEALEKARQSEARLALAQRVAHLGSWEQTFRLGSDPATDYRMEPLGWSDETFRIFGHAPDCPEDPWALFHDGIHPEDRAEVYAVYEEALRAGHRYRIDHRIVRPDGTVRVVHEEADLLLDEASGWPLRVVGTVQDITERQQADAARTRLAAIVDSSTDAIVGKDLNSVVTSWNAGAESIFGYTAQEMVGGSIMRLVPPDRQAEEDHIMSCIRRGERVEHFETVRVTKDGRLIDVSVGVSPIKNADGVVVGASKIARDITALKQAGEHRRAKEEAERANLAKSEFLSRMSHELRTPLNAILGFSQLLDLDTLTPRQHDNVHHIIGGGRHLLRLVDEVLDIARVESGRIEMSPEPVAISELVAETLALIGPLAAQRGIALDVSRMPRPSASDRGPHVTADRQRLRQVLLNLLSNAVKYNAPGGRVGLDCVLQPDRLRLRVTDTGPGIPPEMRGRLFTPFDRLGAEQGNVEGTGLGLALSKRLMEAMGGDLGLEETPAATGAVFWLELPLAADPLEALAVSKGHATIDPVHPEPLPGGRTLLYIEDNLSNLTLIERLLQAHPGVRLLTAMQGTLGLDLARQQHPDLILLDVHLPDVPGWEVLARLQADESTRQIPVVVISADATERQIERLRHAGAHAYLTKPLDVRRFIEVVRGALSARSARSGSASVPLGTDVGRQ